MTKLQLKFIKKTNWQILFHKNNIRIFGYYTNGTSKIKSPEYMLLPRLMKYDKR